MGGFIYILLLFAQLESTVRQNWSESSFGQIKPAWPAARLEAPTAGGADDVFLIIYLDLMLRAADCYREAFNRPKASSFVTTG